jgi:hypothetical protein
MLGIFFQSKPKESTISSAAVKKTNKTKPKPLYFWNSYDVNKWLKKYGGKYFDLYGFLMKPQQKSTHLEINQIF